MPGTMVSTAAREAPAPSVLRTLRILMLFRRMPFERYDFAKPAS